MDSAEKALATTSRAQIYRLLSSLLLAAPDPRLLKAFGEMQPVLENRLATGVTLGLEKLKAFVETHREESIEDLSKQLSIKFTHLFRGIRKGRPPPYESVYTEEGTLYGKATVHVAREYQRFGLAMVGTYAKEPSNHIAVELFCMSHLASLEPQAWSLGEKAEAQELLNLEEQFLEKYILSWIQQLCQNIREWDRTGFYEAVADLVEAWLRLDHKHITASSTHQNDPT